MFIEIDAIREPGRYQIARNPNRYPTIENEGYICTILTRMPFKGEWGLTEFLKTGRDFTKNRGYRAGEGVYEDRPSSKIQNNENFLKVDGSQYLLKYDGSTGHSSRRADILLMDIGGFREIVPNPEIILAPERDGVISLVIKSMLKSLNWGVWIDYQGEKPGDLVVATTSWVNQTVRVNGLNLWQEIANS